MKKNLATLFLMLSFICCIFLCPAKANAASSGSFTKIPCQYETTKKVKIGKYYAYCKKSRIYFSKSKNGKTYYTIKNANSDCFCDGKNVYYISNTTKNYLCRLTLSTKKTKNLKSLAKGDDAGLSLEHVYGSSYYYTQCPNPSTYTLKFYNSKKKKISTIAKNLNDLGFSISIGTGGKYIVFETVTNSNVYIRNCSTGKTTLLKKLHNARTIKMCGNKIAYTVPDSTYNYLYVRIYDVKKKTVSTYAKIGSQNNMFDDGGTFSEDLSSYKVNYTELVNKNDPSTWVEGTYTVNLKTKTVVKKQK